MENKMLYDVDESPSKGQGLLLSLQHIFAMFGSTIIVPMVLGMSVPTALMAGGIGTLIFILVTKAKVPMFLGSSFAYIGGLSYALQVYDGDISAGQTGLILVGLLYVIVALIIKKIGTDWINRLMPPVVIGPMIMVIGLGLAGTAVSNSGLVAGGDWREIVVALVTFSVAAIIQVKGRGFLAMVPFLMAMLVGYLLAVALGLVDFAPVIEANWFQMPDISLPFKTGLSGMNSYQFKITAEGLALLPIAFATIAEHLGAVMVLGEMVGRDFTKRPGLDRTILGTGLASIVSVLFGGQFLATYGENTGVVGMSRVASVSVVRNAAIITVLLSFMGKFTALISTVPSSVIGGMSILLYGVIASNGLKILINNQIDLSNSRNLIIVSSMLVIGLGGAVLELGSVATLSGTALSALVGVILNLVLKDKED